MAEAERIYMCGLLRKRQRGKHIKRESQRKNLKFQGRYCTLTEQSFTYSKKENSKARGSFPAERIRLVISTDPKGFKKGSLPSPDLCFQVGDDKEVLYLIAPTKTEREKWTDAFLKVATERGNTMLDHYHWGAYGSKATGQWSCCNESKRDAPGCKSVAATVTRKDSTVSQTSAKSDDTLISDIDSSTSSIRPSSSCSSGFSNYSSESRWEPVNFDDRVTNVRRSRAGTNESGIDVNQYKKSGVKRKQLPSFDSSEVDSDTMYSLGILSDEGTEDEGIGRNVRKCQGTQAEGKRETVCIDQGVSAVNYDVLIPVYSLTLPQSPTTLLLHQNLLIFGLNGMLQVWNAATTDLTLETSLKIAGQAVSLDSWNDFIAVGSSVVQVIELKPGAEPKRILYTKGKDRLQSSSSQFLVTFLGDSGHVASANVGDRVIDIWAPPSADTQVVTKPESSITIDDGTVMSLKASKHPTHTSVTVLTNKDGCLKLNTLDWKASTLLFSPENSFEMNEGQEVTNYYPHIVNINGMYIASGNKKVVSLIDKNIRQIAHSISLDEDVTCMSYTKGVIMVGTTGGKVVVLSSDNLTKQGQLEDEQSVTSVVAVTAEEDFSCVYTAYSDGCLKVWSDQINDIHESVQGFVPIHNEDHQAFDCVLGQQLCSEGILTQRQTFTLSNQKSLSFQFKDNGASIELPPEILDYPNAVFEAAFSPFGPVGSQFILPDKMIPVSSAVWLCVSPYEKFRSPAMLELSHCFTCNNTEDAKLLHFLKAEHKDIKRDKFGNVTIKFEEVDPAQSEFSPNKQSGTLKDHHFCIYCLAAVSQQEEVVGKINYCLTILKPKLYPTKEHMRIYCILHFDLKGCKKLVEEQMPEDYETVIKDLQFTTGRFESALEIQLNKVEAERCGWVITMESEKKIYAEDVNFYNYRKVDYLEAACKTSDIHKPYPYAYPPRFVLEVSARYAKQYSTIELTFTGARRDLYTEIQLHPLRGEDDLNRLGGSSLGGGDAQSPSRESVPLQFPNGTCEQENDIIDEHDD